MTKRGGRIAGAFQLLLGGFLVVDGFSPWIFPKPGSGFQIGNYLGIAFGGLLALWGVYALVTGTVITRWNVEEPKD